MTRTVKGAPAAELSVSYRQVQAAATRDRIADAARRLFAEHGYGATSIEAIAAEAGVAARTVYSAFGTKREIVSRICEQWLERARARERAEEVLADPDPRGRVRGAAAWLRELYEAGFDVVTILDAATDEDAETRALLRAKLDGRNRVMDRLIASVGPELVVPLPDAQGIYRACAAAGVYRELVEETGWSPEAFELWVADLLERELLGSVKTAARGGRKGSRTV